MATADEVLDQATKAGGTVSLCLRPDLVARIGQLGEEWVAQHAADAMSNEPDKAPFIAEQLQAARAEAVAAEVTFRFEALPGTGPGSWAMLLAEHPDPAGKLNFNPATFPVAAIAASLVEPEGFTPEKVAALGEKINDGQYQALWSTCLTVNRGEGGLPKFAALFALIDSSVPSSTIAPPEASPIPSS